MPYPKKENDERQIEMSFDGFDRVKICRMGTHRVADYSGSFGVHFNPTVNKADYRGLLLGFDLLEDRKQSRVIICGD